jgi:hypothetical protein
MNIINYFQTKLFLMFIGVALLSGCAAIDHKILLSYSTLDRPFGRQSSDISVSRVDPKITKNSKGEWIVGSINNVHGVHQADILSDRNVGEWITDSLILELKHAGYKVTYLSDIPPNIKLGIKISDINTFLNINKGTVSDETKHELRFNVEFFLNGAKLKTFSVASRDNKKLLSASREDMEKIMLHSLQDAILQIIPEITALTASK